MAELLCDTSQVPALVMPMAKPKGRLVQRKPKPEARNDNEEPSQDRDKGGRAETPWAANSLQAGKHEAGNATIKQTSNNKN